MRHLPSERFRKQSGFTLIELIIVIVIIGILGAVALPNLGSSVSDAKTANAAQLQANINTALASAIAACDGGLSGMCPSAMSTALKGKTGSACNTTLVNAALAQPLPSDFDTNYTLGGNAPSCTVAKK